MAERGSLIRAVRTRIHETEAAELVCLLGDIHQIHHSQYFDYTTTSQRGSREEECVTFGSFKIAI